MPSYPVGGGWLENNLNSESLGLLGKRLGYWLGKSGILKIGTIWVGSIEAEHWDSQNSTEPPLPIEASLPPLSDKAGPASLGTSVMTLLRWFPSKEMPVFLLHLFSTTHCSRSITRVKHQHTTKKTSTMAILRGKGLHTKIIEDFGHLYQQKPRE